jgi:phosphoribosylaminoimidazole (AIR) synthetase
MMAVVDPAAADAVRAVFERQGETVFAIGRLHARSGGAPALTLKGADEAWLA